MFPVPPSAWTVEERSALEAAWVTPTPEELSDVALIDSLFGWRMNPYLHVLICNGVSFGRAGREMTIKRPPFSPTPFYCTGAQPLSWGGAIAKSEEFFKLDPAAKWGDQRIVAQNIPTLLSVLKAYPFPSPLSAHLGIWSVIAQEKLAEAARYRWRLDPQVTRFLLTLIVLDTYAQASNEIMDYFEDKAKRQKRNAIITAIVLSVFSLIMPAIMAVGVAALTTVIDANEARQAAKDMIKAAQQFEATDAAFSAEIRKAAEIIDYQAAQEASATDLTPEEEDAIREPGQEGEVTPEEVEAAKSKKPPITELLVGGGVAASLIAFLLLR